MEGRICDKAGDGGMNARERHLEEIRRAKEQYRRAGYCKRRDLGKYIKRLYRELRIYDGFMQKKIDQ